MLGVFHNFTVLQSGSDNFAGLQTISDRILLAYNQVQTEFCWATVGFRQNFDWLHLGSDRILLGNSCVQSVLLCYNRTQTILLGYSQIQTILLGCTRVQTLL